MGFVGSALGLAIAVVGLLVTRLGSSEWLLLMASAAMCTLGWIGVHLSADRERTGAYLLLAAASGGPGAVLLGFGVITIINATQDALAAAIFIILWIFWLPSVLGLLTAMCLLVAAARMLFRDARANAA
jgi:hypothetical protein